MGNITPPPSPAPHTPPPSLILTKPLSFSRSFITFTCPVFYSPVAVEHRRHVGWSNWWSFDWHLWPEVIAHVHVHAFCGRLGPHRSGNEWSDAPRRQVPVWARGRHGVFECPGKIPKPTQIWVSLTLSAQKVQFCQPLRETYLLSEVVRTGTTTAFQSAYAMKSQILHTVWCFLTGEAAGEIWT